LSYQYDMKPSEHPVPHTAAGIVTIVTVILGEMTITMVTMVSGTIGVS